jgi:molecular chaperone DnaK
MIIGIDFGTTNSAVAVYRPNGSEIIETISGDDYMPSVIADTPEGLLTGEAAYRQLRRNPEFTFTNVKRYLGRDYSEQEHGHFHLAEGPDGKVWWQGRTSLLSGPVLVAQILKSLLLAAEVRLGRKPTGAVIAVPVDFLPDQKSALLDAAAIAGLDPKKTHLFEEPYCAALAYRLDREKYERILVYDFGGGTFDATVLKGKGVNTKAVGMSGSAQIGGADFDQRLAEYAVNQFFEKEGEDLRAYPKQMVGILRAAEDAKKVLSRAEMADIQEANVAFPKSGIASLNETVTRDQFEAMTEDLVMRTVNSVNDALAMASMTIEQIDAVLLVGGQSRMPMIRDVLAAMFGEKKIVKDGPRAEQAVALGAAIRAAQIEGRIKDGVMQRIVPSSLGICVWGGAFHAFIPKGKVYPVRGERVIRPALEDQTEIELVVYQGDDPVAASNAEVCRFVVPVEWPGQRVSVMLDVAEDGRLLVWIRGKVVYGASPEMEDAA